jgi:hypothetical protein
MTLRLNGSTSGYTEIDAPASAGNNTLLLPTGNGSNLQALVGDGSGALSFQWNAGSLFYRLNSNRVGSNATGNQSIFGVGVTLASSTVYKFDGLYALHKTAGTTGHIVRFNFGGTATINNIIYSGSICGNASATPTTFDASSSTFLATSTADVDTSTLLTDAGRSQNAAFSGTVSVNAGGTLIPNYSLSVAPGGAYTVQAGSYILFTPIGAAGSDSSQGTWS